MKIRTVLFWLTTLAVVGVPAWMIQQKEALIRDGDLVLLQLEPYDPRSLMQGDYMRLAYMTPADLDSDSLDQRGRFVLKLDANRVGTVDRVFSPDAPLGPDEQLLRFRKRSFRILLGPDAFLFQEGHGAYYANAVYAGLHVDAAGEGVMVGLYDSTFTRIIVPPDAP